ncbi:MAG: PDZ domain-containing protein [Acidobacteriia bacterium]|nr:PDZ domain-containing protein [Terriglobia bacterium]
MERRSFLVTVAATGLLAFAAARPIAQTPGTIDAAFDAFWAAGSPTDAAALVDNIIETGATFDEIHRRLQQGRTYGAQPTGQVRMSNRTSDGVEHNFVLNIPDGYNPSRKYQVRIQLHGGIGGRRDNQPVGAGTIGALAGDPGDDGQIYIIPYAWAAAPWWDDDQVLNLHAIVDAAKRRYNVDENRVVLSGVSDGGTGAYYVAMRDTTPFAAFLPLNGFWMVLAAADIDDGSLFPTNIRNKPFFIVNGGRDPLYPTMEVDPHIAHMKNGGVALEYHPQPNAGHNTQWWPEVKGVYEAFVRAHPRNPLPDTITWETASATHGNRAHWLIIDKFGEARGQAAAPDLPDLNLMPVAPRPDFGTRSIGTRINRIVPGSNAEKIGLKPGDVLMHVNEETVPSSVDVGDALSDVKPGTTLELLVARDNAPVELSGTYAPQTIPAPPRVLFSRGRPSGRVDVTRSGNTVQATTRGVAAFTLLLSPDQFDFSKPVKVVANGRTVFDGRVQKNVRTLLKYAAADNDRTMLFGAELPIDLTREMR